MQYCCHSELIKHLYCLTDLYSALISHTLDGFISLNIFFSGQFYRKRDQDLFSEDWARISLVSHPQGNNSDLTQTLLGSKVKNTMCE